MLLLILSLSIQVFFSPNGGARDAILKEIRNANNEINVAMYVLTDRELSNALVSAKERGVKVKVLLDSKSAEEIGYSKHYFLSEKNVNVKLDNSHKIYGNKYEGIMHNKFAIIDNKTLITGSFNWTHSAEELNDENMLIIKEDTSLTHEYTKEFIKLWNRGNTVNKPVTINPYNLKELRKNVGKWVVISGKPTNWNVSRSGHLFIDFGMGKEQFTFVLWKEGLEKLKEQDFNLEKLNEKEVELKGKLINHEKYGLEITTSDPETIRIIE
ncbi:MAG: phospholipase D family protein [candidate division WOR-3 bacterium]|jgi:phosphatidylserine/phosphatidylglycerophosphate/cardiolipin synthase-like enzyme